jgi:hypothetical protein
VARSSPARSLGKLNTGRRGPSSPLAAPGCLGLRSRNCSNSASDLTSFYGECWARFAQSKTLGVIPGFIFADEILTRPKLKRRAPCFSSALSMPFGKRTVQRVHQLHHSREYGAGYPFLFTQRSYHSKLGKPYAQISRFAKSEPPAVRTAARKTILIQPCTVIPSVYS